MQPRRWSKAGLVSPNHTAGGGTSRTRHRRRRRLLLRVERSRRRCRRRGGAGRRSQRGGPLCARGPTSSSSGEFKPPASNRLESRVGLQTPASTSLRASTRATTPPPGRLSGRKGQRPALVDQSTLRGVCPGRPGREEWIQDGLESRPLKRNEIRTPRVNASSNFLRPASTGKEEQTRRKVGSVRAQRQRTVHPPWYTACLSASAGCSIFLFCCSSRSLSSGAIRSRVAVAGSHHGHHAMTPTSRTSSRVC